jgi:hypothetical protein
MNNVPQLYYKNAFFFTTKNKDKRAKRQTAELLISYGPVSRDCITSKVEKPNKSSKHTAVDFREIEKERVEHICNIIELLSTATDTKSKAKQAQFIHSFIHKYSNRS